MTRPGDASTSGESPSMPPQPRQPPLTDCEQVLRNLHTFIDSELEQASVAQIHAHLEQCQHCLDTVEVERTIKKIVRRCCSQDSAPPGLRERVRRLTVSTQVDADGTRSVRLTDQIDEIVVRPPRD